ncbi:hypothetical protein J4Q44_G00021840 [Coregonus suidteri]|uniref:ZP domain-containing protein n=1 Tax=Coregonus suidteri TaxID=861788 RepID=A0AAN8R810_9TELE
MPSVPRGQNHHTTYFPCSSTRRFPSSIRTCSDQSPGKYVFPSILTNLLLPPQNSPELNQVSPVSNPRGVEVLYRYNQISVRVNRGQLRFRCLASMLFLGTCPVTRVTTLFFYFHYNLNDCGSTQTTMNGQLVYSSSLRFSPEPQGPVIRAIPLNLPIQCIYNRFHYSYKVGYVPEVHDRSLLKSMNGKHIFRLIACNEESYMLGEPMYFKAYATFVPKDENVFVDSCFVTPFKDPNTTPRLEVIHNFGCMVDSKRKGSQSQFFSRESNVLLFTVDAFLFPQITAKVGGAVCAPAVILSVRASLDVSFSEKPDHPSEPWRVLEGREKSLPIQAEERQPDSEERVEETLAVTYRVEEKVKFKSLAVTPWGEEEKNMSVAVMNKVEVVEEGAQEGTVIGVRGGVSQKRSGGGD